MTDQIFRITIQPLKLEVIIAPVIVFLAMIALLTAARFYEHLPVKPPSCSFKRVTGIPCVACRGTRSLRALAHGKVGKAIAYNPLAVLSCAIAFFWIGGYVVRKGQPPARRLLSPRGVAVVTIVLLIANWIYLILTGNNESFQGSVPGTVSECTWYDGAALMWTPASSLSGKES